MGLVALVLGASMMLSACSQPPVLTKAQVDSKKLSKKHPKLTAEQLKDCTKCHKVVATPKNP
jgi:hypothetical protein